MRSIDVLWRHKVFEQILKDIILENKVMKQMMFAGNFNINLLDYEYNKKF